MGGEAPTTSIVAWPPGFTGLRVGSAVEVHNGNGNLVRCHRPPLRQTARRLR